MTGGPDLSLMEVSEASSIVQEAADEDANIIFGAVVDPTLKGRVKITVIATGFGAPAPRGARRPAQQTPVDLNHYATRPRSQEPVGMPVASRSLARRPSVELPAPMAMAVGGESQPFEHMEEVSPLDVPAFLRRQHEG